MKNSKHLLAAFRTTLFSKSFSEAHRVTAERLHARELLVLVRGYIPMSKMARAWTEGS